MLTAPVTRAEYLKQPELRVTATDATTLGRWGDDAADTTQSTALVEEADAIAEAERQLALMGVPTARDAAVLVGLWQDLEGETIELEYDGSRGLTGLHRMLVLRARPDPQIGRTEVEGLVRL